MKSFFQILFFVLLSPTAFSQSDSSAKVYVIRATGHNGALVNLRLAIDDDLYCKVANNRYSVITLPPGTYTFYLTSWDAPKKREKLGLKIPMEAGKSYYLRAIHKTRFMENQMYIEEITLNSAVPLLKKYKEDTNCKK